MDLDMATPSTPKIRLDIYPSAELRKAIDRWRIEQDNAPTRAEAVRQLLEETLTERGAFKPAAKAPAKRKGRA
jgi:hypothetical protein